MPADPRSGNRYIASGLCGDVPVSVDALADLLIYATCYAVARLSFTSGGVARTVRRYAWHLSDADLGILARDIDEALTLDKIPFDYQRTEWRNTLNTIRDIQWARKELTT